MQILFSLPVKYKYSSTWFFGNEALICSIALALSWSPWKVSKILLIGSFSSLTEQIQRMKSFCFSYCPAQRFYCLFLLNGIICFRLKQQYITTTTDNFKWGRTYAIGQSILTRCSCELSWEWIRDLALITCCLLKVFYKKKIIS